MEQKALVTTDGYPIFEWLPGVNIDDYNEEKQEQEIYTEEDAIMVNDFQEYEEQVNDVQEKRRKGNTR